VSTTLVDVPRIAAEVEDDRKFVAMNSASAMPRRATDALSAPSIDAFEARRRALLRRKAALKADVREQLHLVRRSFLEGPAAHPAETSAVPSGQFEETPVSTYAGIAATRTRRRPGR
jgi:hypothetical protein